VVNTKKVYSIIIDRSTDWCILFLGSYRSGYEGEVMVTVVILVVVVVLLVVVVASRISVEMVVVVMAKILV